MRHNVAGRSFSRSTGHRQMMFRNLITDLLRYGRITTTEAKAKAIRGDTERLISMAKRANREDATSVVNAHRQVDRVVREKSVSTKLFDDLATKLKDRAGGYTRVYKVGPRHGDGAPMVIIELVER